MSAKLNIFSQFGRQIVKSGYYHSNAMDFPNIIRCLNSQLRRKILQLLSCDDMSAPQIFERLGVQAPLYRQSINKALEMLRKSGLISKYYDNDKKGIYYHLTSDILTIKLNTLSIQLDKNNTGGINQ